MSNPANTTEQNLLPVQAYFDEQGNFQTFIGQGKPFYAIVNPSQSGLHITNSTIDSTTIGATTPSTGVFTNIFSTTGQVTTSPSAAIDIANKAYVDAVAQGLAPKQACKVATTADITLSGLQTLDTTYTTVAGDRVLVKNQANTAQNGIYIASSGAWTRSADMNVWSEVPGAYTVILNGATQGSTSWVTTAADTGTIGVTAMPWVQFASVDTYYAGTGLNLLANTFSIANTGVTAATYGSASKTLTLAVNAQGQITSASASDIAIAASQITSGILSGTYGGTGVNNGANTLTLGGSYTLNQSVASGAAPSFLGTNFSSIPNGALTNSSITVNGTSISLGGSATITAVNPYALTIGTGLSGTSYDGSSGVTIAISNTGVTPTSYTYANFTVNAQGQLTAASSNATTGTGSIVLANAPTISGAWGSPDSLQFNTGATVTPAVGKIWWDGGTTLNLGMTTNVIQKVGEDQFYYVKASSAITKGEVCMFTGSVGASGVITAAPATGVTDGSYIMGIAAESIAHNGFGLIQSFGILRNVDTSGYADGDILWYDPSVTGGLTKTKPSAPNVKVQMAAVVNGGSSGGGVIQIRVTSGSVLGGTDSNVQFGTLNNGDVIVYNSTLGYWANYAQSTLTAGKATNLAGGAAASIPYQTAADTTAFLASSAGDAGKVLTSNGTSAPSWTTPTAYATVTDDTTTNSTRYPLFASVTTGNLTTEYVSSTKYQFNPSTGILTATGFSGSGANLTSLPAGQLSGTIPSAVLGNSTLYVGTTAIALNRASGSQTLTGTSIDGNAATATSATSATNTTNVAVTDDTSTNATYYVAVMSASTGNVGVKVSSTKLQYNPSTGALTATGGIGGGTF